jgi:hypothetical protein
VTTAARLVALYPVPWRARFGPEFQLLLVAQPLTPWLAFDVLVGAIDAYLSGGRMTMKMMARCAAGGPQMGTADTWRATLVMLGISIALCGLLMFGKAAFDDNPFVDAFASMAFPAAFLVTWPFLFMRDASRRRKLAVTGFSLLVMVAAAILSVAI